MGEAIVKGLPVTTTITICDTCKREDWPERGMERTDGEVFAELIETAALGDARVQTRRHSCLMGCARACNIAIQAKGKLTYVLGTFEPDADAAQAVVDYAGLHSDSETGQVPFRSWPKGVKGHFVTRLPLLAEDRAD